MAEPTFDRGVFAARLTTRRLGRTLIARAETSSTNDLAWEGFQQGAPDGAAYVADVQWGGRGRAGRSWHTSPGKGLALSVLLLQGRERGRSPRAAVSGILSLAAGLALARGLEALGLVARLKWPNDLLAGSRKLAGTLSESRGTVTGEDVAVVGVGINVSQQRSDFPPELRETATSLALEGCVTDRAAAAASFLNALEPLWVVYQEGGREQVLAAWRQRAAFWGEPVTVHTPSGALTGTARDLDPDGGLVLRLESGQEVTVFAGDVEVAS